jgi:hypothetical protein
MTNPSLKELAALYGDRAKPRKGALTRANARAPKYRNKKVEHDGMKFDSKAELARFLTLKTLERAGHIQQLRRQVPFALVPAVVLDGRTKPAIRFFADFTYQEDGVLVVEDVKSPVTRNTDAYRMKKHMMKCFHGIEIKEVK